MKLLALITERITEWNITSLIYVHHQPRRFTPHRRSRHHGTNPCILTSTKQNFIYEESRLHVSSFPAIFTSSKFLIASSVAASGSLHHSFPVPTAHKDDRLGRLRTCIGITKNEGMREKQNKLDTMEHNKNGAKNWQFCLSEKKTRTTRWLRLRANAFDVVFLPRSTTQQKGWS